MTVIEAINERHSVRSYTDKPIEKEKAAQLRELAEECNRRSGLHFQIITDEPQGFTGFWAHYGKITGVNNYIVVAGAPGKEIEAGYYGETLVLKAQMLGLNTCWVALTFSKRKAKKHYELAKGEKLYLVIALGYGQTQGHPHKSKDIHEIADIADSSPEWYKNGIEAVLLAPTAINQQKFSFCLDGEKVIASPGSGVHTKIDLGIAEYHFDIGSDRNNFGFEREIL